MSHIDHSAQPPEREWCRAWVVVNNVRHKCGYVAGHVEPHYQEEFWGNEGESDIYRWSDGADDD